MKVTLIHSVLLLSLLYACKNSKHTAVTTKPRYEKTAENKYVISGQIVFEKFVGKNGKQADFTEAYMRQSVQDYFIKFCESTVTRKELETYLAEKKDPLNSITIEGEIREGSWDICDSNIEQQSRIGKYVVIYKIIEK